jgi:predicted Rossmann fold flavoprotein
MSRNTGYDVIVVGGGASGMMAAGRAAERGRRVLLLEKNKTLGKKLSITGGGRCNILNAETNQRKLLSHFDSSAKFLHSAFAQHGMQDSWDFFANRGLPLVVEARQRAFPKSMSAPDVTKTMRDYLVKNRVEIKTGESVTELRSEGEQIRTVVTKAGQCYESESVILATGGASHQETGSTGEAFEWLRNLGYEVHEPNPNLVPLVVAEDWVTQLSGTTLSFMKITFGVDQPKSNGTEPGRFSRTGKLLFTHFGLSGPRILNAAHEVKRLLSSGPVPTAIDMYPDTEVGTVRNRVLEAFLAHKNKHVRTVVRYIAPAGMAEAVLAQLPQPMRDKKVHSVTKEERQSLADVMKAMPLTVIDTKGLDWSVISDGGIALTEVDTRTMATRRYPNLYLTGDLLHINRPSGGYSLQLCWTTGWVAGSAV